MTATAGGTATGRRRMAVRICPGGWPSDLGVADDDAMQSNIDYLEVVAEIDLERMDGVRRAPLWWLASSSGDVCRRPGP